ncbi:MAG: dihydroorotate dehydrogenase [Caldithrix sp.]|nr:MAG: dihydroorotate dehydrogenase [Caldithrix sp.]
MADLSVQIGSLKLKNPVLVASGTFGYGKESAALVNLDKLGGIVTKSVSPKPRDGNPPPRIVELPAGMLNSIGLQNVGVEAFVKEKLPFLKTVDTALIVNIAGSTSKEFLTVVHRLESEEGIDGYELNFSCPNVKEGGLEFSQDPKVTAQVTAFIRKATKRPLIVKLTPNVTRVGEIARAAADSGADAVSLINTLVGMSVDVELGRPKINTITAGYSGPAIKPIALAKVYEVAQHVTIPIIGIGGIMNTQDALEFLITGATAIEVGTANFLDPRTGERIAAELSDYCEEHNLASISELVGSLKT